MTFLTRFGSVMMIGALALAAPQMVRADEAPAPVTLTLAPGALDGAIKDYIQRNPEVLVDVMNKYQTMQQQKKLEEEKKKQEAAQAAVQSGSKDAEIYNAGSPVAGNPNGNETLVEFFDYACHYCKQIHPDLQALISQDPSLKVVYKDFPILSPGSTLAAKAALAANLQGKYLPMHDALLDLKGNIDDEAIKQAAQTAGVDYAKLKTDMDNPDIAKQLAANASLADALNIHSTPSMIINKQLVDGALPLEQLKQKVQTKG